MAFYVGCAAARVRRGDGDRAANPHPCVSPATNTRTRAVSTDRKAGDRSWPCARCLWRKGGAQSGRRGQERDAISRYAAVEHALHGGQALPSLLAHGSDRKVHSVVHQDVETKPPSIA